MPEYIEREALMSQIRLTASRSSVGEISLNDISVKTICGLILEAPTADVVEVKHGEWKDNGDRDSNGVAKPFAISCSVCGSSAGTSWMNYCPNCGAKMDLKEGAEE